jgi:hypothetical protein
MNRTAASAYLTTEFAEIATDAQLDAAALAIAYSTVIDMALRKLGYVEADLATANVGQESLGAYIALLDYYALNRFAAKLYSVRVDATVNNAISASRSQAYKALSSAVDKAAAYCASLGYPVDAAGQAQTMEVGRFNLDFQEPCTTGGEFC